jgi:hypothetical protein
MRGTDLWQLGAPISSLFLPLALARGHCGCCSEVTGTSREKRRQRMNHGHSGQCPALQDSLRRSEEAASQQTPGAVGRGLPLSPSLATLKPPHSASQGPSEPCSYFGLLSPVLWDSLSLLYTRSLRLAFESLCLQHCGQNGPGGEPGGVTGQGLNSAYKSSQMGFSPWWLLRPQGQTAHNYTGLISPSR